MPPSFGKQLQLRQSGKRDGSFRKDAVCCVCRTRGNVRRIPGIFLTVEYESVLYADMRRYADITRGCRLYESDGGKSGFRLETW